jgi:hypothetical protein
MSTITEYLNMAYQLAPVLGLFGLMIGLCIIARKLPN